MGARQELNKVHVIGSLGLAGLLGLMSGSLAVFMIAGAVMIATSICTGEIRGKNDMRPGNRRHGR